MKTELNLSYKKGGSRPWDLNLKKQKLLKKLYTMRLSRAMKSWKDIINIDESWLNKNTKISYSWLQKGKKCNLTNTKFTNSISLISAIWTNGFALDVISYGTVNGSKFVEFLSILSEEMRVKSAMNLSDFIILMDNWAVHRSKLVRDFIVSNKMKVHFNVPYSPEPAPI